MEAIRKQLLRDVKKFTDIMNSSNNKNIINSCQEKIDDINKMLG